MGSKGNKGGKGEAAPVSTAAKPGEDSFVLGPDGKAYPNLDSGPVGTLPAHALGTLIERAVSNGTKQANWWESKKGREQFIEAAREAGAEFVKIMEGTNGKPEGKRDTSAKRREFMRRVQAEAMLERRQRLAEALFEQRVRREGAPAIDDIKAWAVECSKAACAFWCQLEAEEDQALREMMEAIVVDAPDTDDAEAKRAAGAEVAAGEAQQRATTAEAKAGEPATAGTSGASSAAA